MAASGAQNGAAPGVWERSAPAYDGWMRVYDRIMLGDGREWVTACAEGLVLEVAVGTGLNLPAYRSGTAVVGVDLSGGMLGVARERAAAREPGAVLVRGPAEPRRSLPLLAGGGFRIEEAERTRAGMIERLAAVKTV
jgi:SAM-dependent methyltransferase